MASGGAEQANGLFVRVYETLSMHVHERTANSFLRAQAIVDTLGEYARLGLSHVLLEFRRDDLGRMLAILDLVTARVRPALERA